jgi:hypothetical protein
VEGAKDNSGTAAAKINRNPKRPAQSAGSSLLPTNRCSLMAAGKGLFYA